MKRIGVDKKEAINLITKNSAFSEGDKVKIDSERILGRKDATRLREEYKNFVLENKDRVFTLEKDEKHKNFFVFKEDTSNPKWLWFSGDLVRAEEAEAEN